MPDTTANFITLDHKTTPTPEKASQSDLAIRAAFLYGRCGGMRDADTAVRFGIFIENPNCTEAEILAAMDDARRVNYLGTGRA